MANDYYTKNTWTARQGVGLDKFTLTESGNKTIISPSPDSVTQQGTPLSAATFNDLESRIDTGFDNVATAVAGKTAVKLNGSNAALSDISIYAPSNGGASGQVLQSNGQLAPSWTKKTAVKLNGSNTVSNDASVYAPTASGTSGEVLKSNGANAAPTWTAKTAVKLNGANAVSSDIAIYAPTSAGDSGQVLISNGSGAPSWGESSDSVVWSSVTEVTVNGNTGSSKPSAFYAPTSVGTYGQTLVSLGSGSAPTWTSRQYSMTEIYQDTYPSSASSSLFYFVNSSNSIVTGITSFVVWRTIIYNISDTIVQKIFRIRANTNGTDFAKLHLPSGQFGTFSKMGCVLATGDDSNSHTDYLDNLQWGNSSTTYLVFYNRSANKYKNYIIWGI